MKTTVIIPAAGTGSRMGGLKQFMLLGGKAVLAHTIEAFEKHEEVDEIILAAPEQAAEWTYKKVKAILAGGPTRQASVYAALSRAEADCILIHDGARPLIRQQAISEVIKHVRQGHCAVSGVLAKDTIKIAAGDNNIVQHTPPRSQTWLVQTPQGFPAHIIKEAHRRAAAESFLGTDDAMLVERMGIAVHMVQGDYCNIKITTPEDLRIAEELLHI